MRRITLTKIGRVRKEKEANRVDEVSKVQQVKKAIVAIVVLKVLKEIQERGGHKEIKDQEVNRDHKVFKGQQDQKGTNQIMSGMSRNYALKTPMDHGGHLSI